MKRRDSKCAARHVAAIFDPEQEAGDRSSSGSTNSPIHAYPKQVFMAGTAPHDDEDEPAYPLEVDMPDQTKLVITRDMAIQAMKHVDEGTFPPPNASRDDHLAVQYLLRKEGERIRAEKAELLRRKREIGRASCRERVYVLV